MTLIDPRHLDRESATPRYLQLADLIRARIRKSGIDEGQALPSERELAERLGLSRVTVRKALDVLLREGLLSRRHGSGTYVAPRIEQAGALLAGFSADISARGQRPGSQMIDRGTGLPMPDEAMALGLSPDALVHRLTRVRMADGEPLALECAVIPVACLRSLDLVSDSLYAALEAQGRKPVRGVQRIQASLATPQEARLLSIPPGAAILRIERRSFLANGTPVELTRSAYRGDRYDFIMEVREPSASSRTAKRARRAGA
jgi:GntR family transcriptional regulator